MSGTENIREIGMIVEAPDTAEMVGSGGLPVLATPRVAALFEKGAFELLQERLLTGQSSVGTFVSVEHVSPTPVGMEISVKAELLTFDGKRAEFELSASDSAGEIARGTHTRVVIDTERFMEKVRSKAP